MVENYRLRAAVEAANNLYANWYAYNRQAFGDAMFRALDDLGEKED